MTTSKRVKTSFFLILAIAFPAVSTGFAHERTQAARTQAAPTQAAPTQGEKTRTGKPGLLIMTHGAPTPEWNKKVKVFEEKVKKLNETKKTFHCIVAANLEFNSPSPQEAVAELELAGCDRIIVVPLFVMPGSHTIRDLPAVMGVYYSPSLREKMMADESHAGHDHAPSQGHSARNRTGCILHQAARPKVPVTITHTMEEGGFLERYLADEVTALSQNPSEESVLLLVHGDAGYAGVLDPLMQHLADRVVEETQVAAAERANCQVGQSYLQNAIPAINRLAGRSKRVLVIGMYVASSAKEIHQRAMGRNGEEVSKPFGVNIRFSENDIITHPQAVTWVFQSAEGAL